MCRRTILTLHGSRACHIRCHQALLAITTRCPDEPGIRRNERPRVVTPATYLRPAMENDMSYDPNRFTIEWRDIGASYLLGAAALVGLALFSVSTESADRAVLSPAPMAVHVKAPAGLHVDQDEAWLDSVWHAEWHDESLPTWRPVRVQACAPDCITQKASRSPS